MLKYAKLDKDGKVLQVGLGTDTEFYKSVGMELIDVEQGWDGNWYLVGFAPIRPEPTISEQVAKLEVETGLTRVMREVILAENSGASEYVKAKAQEIEYLAKELRTVDTPNNILTKDNIRDDSL